MIAVLQRWDWVFKVTSASPDSSIWALKHPPRQSARARIWTRSQHGCRNDFYVFFQGIGAIQRSAVPQGSVARHWPDAAVARGHHRAAGVGRWVAGRGCGDAAFGGGGTVGR